MDTEPKQEKENKAFTCPADPAEANLCDACQ